MRWMASAAIITLAASSSYAHAQEPRLAAEAVCNSEVAHVTTISEIAAAGAAAVGRCVTVSGVLDFQRVYADNTSRYRRERRYNDPSSTGAILGVGGQLQPAAPVNATLTGRVGDCDQLVLGANNGVPYDAFLGAYCGNNRGLYLSVVETRFGEAQPLIRIGRGAGQGLGEMVALPQSEARARLVAAGDALLQASSNPTALRAMLRSYYGEVRESGQIDEMIAALQRDGSVVRNSVIGSIVARDILGWLPPPEIDEEARRSFEEVARTTVEGVYCVSPRQNAQEIWPISVSDTMDWLGRPYFCTHIAIRGDSAPEYEFSPLQNTGVIEPAP